MPTSPALRILAAARHARISSDTAFGPATCVWLPPRPAAEHGLVLYPHFQQAVVPGWRDKAWTRRHRCTPFLDNVVVLAPDPQWVRTLPGGKLPDRSDFKRYASRLGDRVRDWSRAAAESVRLAEELAEALQRGPGMRVEPL